jgi:hypothetical protein
MSNQSLSEGPRYFEAMQGLVITNGSPITTCSGTKFNLQMGTGATTGSAGWQSFNEKFKVAPLVFVQAITGSSTCYVQTTAVGSFFVVGSTAQPFNWLAIGQRS